MHYEDLTANLNEKNEKVWDEDNCRRIKRYMGTIISSENMIIMGKGRDNTKFEIHTLWGVY